MIIIINTINLTKSQSCNNSIPTDAFSCNKINPVNKYNKCCFLENIKTSSIKLCLEIPTSSITKSNVYKYNKEIYKISCPQIPQIEILPLCGDNNIVPAGQGDCAVYSSFAKSCCYNKTNKKCSLLDTKYFGEITYAGMNLDCVSWKIKFTYGLFIILLALFFI